MKNTESLANSSNEARLVFYCPDSPEYIWDVNETTRFKVIVAITAIACPVTILLNLLVIIATRTRSDLKKHSNILLSRVALTDLLVGVVTMPVAITLDSLIIQRVFTVNVICTIDILSVSLLHIGCWASFFHLLLIAWERYVAIVKWMEYRVIVTKDRVNTYTGVAWISSLLIVVSLVIMEAASVPHEQLLVLNAILTIFWFVCLSLMAYFYVKAYLAVRTRNRTQDSSVNVLVKRKFQKKFASTTFWLTVFFAVSGFPTLVVYLFREVLPFFRQVSTIRFAETIFLLNSLFNPLLYWYRNRRLRIATLELLKCGNRPEARVARRITPYRCPVMSRDVENLQRPRVLSAESLSFMLCSDTPRRRSSKAEKETPMTASSKVASEEIFTEQRNQEIVTVRIGNAPSHRKTELPKNTTELIGDKTARSISVTENSFVSLAECLQNAIQNITQRSRSEPMIKPNFNEPMAILTVNELTTKL